MCSFQLLQTIPMTEDNSIYFVDCRLSVSLFISPQAKAHSTVYFVTVEII